MFDEFTAAFQFPYYFGENWAAFRDCITDLDWLPFRPGVVVVIYGAEQVLQDAHPAELGTLVTSLSSAAEEFGEAVADEEWWDRRQCRSTSSCRAQPTMSSSGGVQLAPRLHR